MSHDQHLIRHTQKVYHFTLNTRKKLPKYTSRPDTQLTLLMEPVLQRRPYAFFLPRLFRP